MKKASGDDRIPVELFQILKDAVKVLHSICQQIWKTQQWPQDWKRSVFIPIPKKGNAKECSNYHTFAVISHTSKVMLKILQARLQQCMNRELPNVQAGFRKGRGTRDQIANNRWIGPHWGRSLTVAQLFICTFISQGFKLLENRKHVFSSSCLQGLDQCLPRREPFMNIYQGTEQSMWSLEFIGDPSYLC